MIDFKRPKKEDYDFNDNIEGVRYAKDMNDYADKLEKQLWLYLVSQHRELFYNFITWYNAKAKVNKPKDGLITTNIIEEYLKL